MAFDNGQRFKNPITLRFEGQRHAVFEKGVRIHDEYFPEGWVTDGASVPPSAQSVIPRWVVQAAFPHDRRYEEILKALSAGLITKKEAKKLRKKADKEFKKNLKIDHYNIIRRTLAYRAVRMFGWKSFEKADRMALIEKASK